MVEAIWWATLTITYEVLAAFILVFWLIFWIVHIIGIIHGCHMFLHRGLPPQPGAQAADLGKAVLGVTVLKPLLGKPMDPNLMTNLESFFTLAYPKYELQFCVAEEGDPCIMVVKQLMSKYPSVDATLHVGVSDVGVNPKINNIHKGYKASRYPLLLISDSGIFMKPDVLAEMVTKMTPDTGIVHQMPFVTDRKGWPATLEKVYFGTQQSRMYLFLNLLERLHFHVNCMTGMSCLIRKEVLEHAGGLSHFSQYLAEDYFLAHYATSNGWAMRLSSFPAMQNHGIYSVDSVMARNVRWTKLRLAMVPGATLLLEPLSECLMIGILASLGATVHLKADFLAFFLMHVLAWILADWTLLNIVQNGPPPFSKFEFAITWMFREATSFLVFVTAFRNPEVVWRTSRFVLHWGGRAERLPMGDKTGVSVV